MTLIRRIGEDTASSLSPLHPTTYLEETRGSGLTNTAAKKTRRHLLRVRPPDHQAETDCRSTSSPAARPAAADERSAHDHVAPETHQGARHAVESFLRTT